MRDSWKGARSTQRWPERGLSVILGLTCMFMGALSVVAYRPEPPGSQVGDTEKSKTQVLA